MSREEVVTGPDLVFAPKARRTGERFEPGRAARILLLACAAVLAHSAAQVLVFGPIRAASAPPAARVSFAGNPNDGQLGGQLNGGQLNGGRP